MKQYVSKSALVAEIKRRKDESWLGHYTKEKGIVFDITDDILSWIDTLEVKEVENPNNAFIEKAAKWLSKHATKYYLGAKPMGTDELVEDFKIAMEL